MKHILPLSIALLGCLAASAQKMAVLTDIHITPGNASEPRLREAVREINAAPFDMVLLTGDLTNEGSDRELANVKSILDSISHPLFVIPGNHETTWSQSATKTFFDTFGNDRFVTEKDSLIIIGISCGPFMKMGDGHIKTEDLAWLQSTLDERLAPGKRVLSVNHYPLNEDLDNFYEYTDALSHYPVIAHINGHYHRWIDYTAGDVPGAIPGAMVRALDMKDGDYGYSIVEVTPDSVFVSEKRLGMPAARRFAFAAETEHTPVPHEPVVWSEPDGFSVRCLTNDHASVFTRVAFDNENVYFGNSLGEAVAVSRATGRRLWAVPTGASLFSRPFVLDSGNIAFPTATGVLVISPEGRRTDFYPSVEGPYVADGIRTPYGWLQGGYKRLEMRDPGTAALVWTLDSLGNYCQGAPTLSPDSAKAVFGAWDTNLRSVNLSDGSVNWKWNNGRAANMLGPGNVVPVVNESQIIVVAPDRFMTAVDPATGATIWRDNSHRYRESLGASADRTRAYAKTMDGELVCVDATAPEFTELWAVDMGIGYDHAPCIVLEHDGVVYAGSRRGIITAVDPATRQVLWSLPLGTSEVNGFEVDPVTGTVFASLIEGSVFAIDKK
ncbi:MAG: PQQ-binding-like beta-propeller repeat protein [Muribaculaceae bacterium]|nr:PQQ-binding-like beta-propeller repeat protein [Muribaculaceae bacterium]